jgi:hypothetical protein
MSNVKNTDFEKEQLLNLNLRLFSKIRMKTIKNDYFGSLLKHRFDLYYFLNLRELLTQRDSKKERHQGYLDLK